MLRLFLVTLIFSFATGTLFAANTPNFVIIFMDDIYH